MSDEEDFLSASEGEEDEEETETSAIESKSNEPSPEKTSTTASSQPSKNLSLSSNSSPQKPAESPLNELSLHENDSLASETKSNPAKEPSEISKTEISPSSKSSTSDKNSRPSNLPIRNLSDPSSKASSSSLIAPGKQQENPKPKEEKHAESQKGKEQPNPISQEEDGWEGIGWDDLLTPPEIELPAIGDRQGKLGGRQPELRLLDTPVTPASAKKVEEEKAVDRPSSFGGSIAGGSAGVGGWGWNSVLSAATDHITTISEGFNSVIESVESGFGAPTPEELARLSLEERSELAKRVDDMKEPEPDTPSNPNLGIGASMTGGSSTAPSGGLGDLFSGVTSVFESTGKTLVAGGVDVLESLGKATFSALTTEEIVDGIPTDGRKDSSKKRRKFILSPPNPSNKPNLSSILRELKDRDAADLTLGSSISAQNKEMDMLNFATIFEEAQGMMNVEALEMLSKKCEDELRDVSELDLDASASDLQVINDIFDPTHEDNTTTSSSSEQTSNDGDHCITLEDSIRKHLERLSLSYTPNKLLNTHKREIDWLDDCSAKQDGGVGAFTTKELYKRALECLAEITSGGLEMFLKLSQLLLLKTDEKRSAPVVESAKIFKTLMELLDEEINQMSARYSTCMNTAVVVEDTEDPDSVTSQLITNLFLEANNCSGYVRQSFNLLKSVLQLAYIQNKVAVDN